MPVKYIKAASQEKLPQDILLSPSVIVGFTWLYYRLKNVTHKICAILVPAI